MDDLAAYECTATLEVSMMGALGSANTILLAKRVIASVWGLCSIALLHPTLAYADAYIPPDRYLPGIRREGGGTRGGYIFTAEPLTAIVPSSNYGTTTLAQPFFLFYIPEGIVGSTAEFLIETEDETVYSYIFTITEESGILALPLEQEDNAFSLDPNVDYRWSLILDDSEHQVRQSVSGWIERISPDADFLEALNQMEPSSRPMFYAQAGIWFDAIASLAALRSENPDDSDLETQWIQLLESIGLDDIAERPLLLSPPAADPEPSNSESSTLQRTGGRSTGGGGGLTGGESFYHPPDRPIPGRREGGGTR